MSAQVAVVGIGYHGRGIAKAIIAQGHHRLVGAADPARVGQSLADAIDETGASQVPVVADALELLSGERPDVIIITAPLDLEALRSLMSPFLTAGVNVLTILPDAFDPPEDWAAAVDADAKAGGASFFSTGVQDAWWVHVPATAAASMTRIERIEVSHQVDLNTLSAALGGMFGLGRDASEFDQIRDEVVLGDASVLGGPLRVLARRLGLNPGDIERDVQPLNASAPLAWKPADTEIQPGQLIGFSENVEITTEEGVRLSGRMVTAVLRDDQMPFDHVTLHGEPTLVLKHEPFPGEHVTDLVPVSRISDIVDASPGLHTAATMPAPRYRHPVAS